jgi:LysM repeat protein
MVMAFMIGGFIFNATVSGAVEPALETVLIQPGDTIWAIADVYRPENSDTRAYVKKICNLNDIEPGKIYPGQTIQVPIYDAA